VDIKRIAHYISQGRVETPSRRGEQFCCSFVANSLQYQCAKNCKYNAVWQSYCKSKRMQFFCLTVYKHAAKHQFLDSRITMKIDILTCNKIRVFYYHHQHSELELCQQNTVKLFVPGNLCIPCHLGDISEDWRNHSCQWELSRGQQSVCSRRRGLSVMMSGCCERSQCNHKCRSSRAT